MSENACLLVVEEELGRAGLPYRVETSGRHIHILWGADFSRLHVVAKTPSDWRAPLNERASIRREIAEVAVPEPVFVPEVVPVRFEAGEAVCFSHDLAERFSKNHKDVLRAIDNARRDCGEEFDRRNFAPVEYADPKGRKYRAYRLTRDGFVLVAMGFTGAAATAWKVRFLEAFNAMEAQIRAIAGPSPEIASLRSDIDALVAIVGDVEARSCRPATFVHPRQLQRQAQRREARRTSVGAAMRRS